MLHITINGHVFQAARGAKLLDLLRANGFPLRTDCAGRGSCGKCAVTVDGQPRLACQLRLEEDCEVRLPERRRVPALSAYELPGRHALEAREGLGLAIDLGTSTVAMELVDLATGESLESQGFENPQRAFGADLISRVDAAGHGHGEQLRALIHDAIETRVRQYDPVELVIAGNTTMIHLLLGLDCGPLGLYPFELKARLENPYTLFGREAFIVPWISAFVGGDIVSGLSALPFDEDLLLVDLGTNGEIALRRGGRLLCASAAAGPAFEGGAHGLYGSQALDSVAGLRARGALDETGLLLGESVLSQADIRAIQLAKSAVRTGIEILLDTAGRPAPERVYLCGGFGRAMDLRGALAIGLFPAEWEDRILPLGNASLAGAVKLLKEPGLRGGLDELTKAETISLAAHPSFSDRFIRFMSF
ncbi:MAG: ASKHA domain-containing protein [Oscillospiraceae bacterium]|nr:ASKHA domain-containing protein [Oscillospiraceae bacterium]